MQSHVYSAIIGGKDAPRTDIKCFTENTRFTSPNLGAKIYKVLSHLYIEDWSVWVDGNIFLKVTPETLLDMLGDKEIGVFPNPYRGCLYDEAEFCMEYKKDDPDRILEQAERYELSGYPTKNGLAACGVMVRKHTERVKQMNERWWAEICRGSVRDQISFPYVFGDAIHYFPRVDLWDNKYFKREKHKIPEATW